MMIRFQLERVVTFTRGKGAGRYSRKESARRRESICFLGEGGKPTFGELAQLVERYTGCVQVRGSSPLLSTIEVISYFCYKHSIVLMATSKPETLRSDIREAG